MSPFDQALARLGRRTTVPVRDIGAMFRDVLAGDQVVMGLVSKGYATREGDSLVITEQGRRRLASG